MRCALLLSCSLALIGCSRSASAPLFSADAAESYQPGTSYVQTLYRFTGRGDGRVPVGSLLDEAGTLYGTTNFGGDPSKDCTPGRGCGAVFSVNGSGNGSGLYDFKAPKNGLRPYAGLVEVNGALVGTTQNGGTHDDGTVFSVTTAGRENVLYNFAGKDGNDPRAALTVANGVLYGTTYLGGSAGAGTIFSLTPSGTTYVERVLHSFKGGSDGALPTDALLSVGGALYGTTSKGGASNDGIIFEIGYDGGEKILYSFKGGAADGAVPLAGLTESDGVLYGTTSFGGAQDKGTVFMLTAGASESVLHSFGAGTDGAEPDAGITAFNGRLYGSTRRGGSSNGGTIYTITPSGYEDVLYGFTGGSDGSAPYGNLIAGGAALYGTTLFGGLGKGYGDGTVFELTPQTAPPSVTRQRVRADTTSILKKLTVQVTIGSTVDAENGDEGPRAINVVPHTKAKLAKGQLLVCNFENSKGAPGEGTTIEVLDPTPGSQPVRFVQNDSIEGCDGDAVDSAGYVFGGGLTSGRVVEFSQSGAPVRTYRRAPISAPFADVVAPSPQQFGPEQVFVGTTHGGIVSISTGFYGNGDDVQVAKGFATSDGSQGEIAPSGLQYDQRIDTLYVVDGVTNTVVAFSNASELLERNEIVVEPGGVTFKCKHPETTCGSVVYSGSPLDAPMAATLLPNGNLIVANTQGTANTLVELTPQGQVLDTKVVDSSATQGVFGLAAAGANDDNTVLFFTDTNSSTVQELKQ